MAKEPLGDVTASANARPLPGEKNSTKKRKAEDGPVPFIPDPDDFDDMNAMDKTPNQVRGQINRYIESGEMKKGEFAKAIGVNARSLSGFLTTSGTHGGSGYAAYPAAWQFFKQRELAGIKLPKKAKADPKLAAANNPDISKIHLEGEEEQKVEVYDTCDEIRKKINAHLVKPGVTAASFCRDLSAQLHDSSKVQTRQLSAFRGKKGASSGNTSCVFYTAYVFFEKQRLAGKKPKSKHRLEMEEAWPKGFDIERSTSGGFFCLPNERPYEDNLGKIHFVRR